MQQSDFFGIDDDAGTISLPTAIGERIAGRLADGCHLNRGVIASLFAEATGVRDWGTAWSIDDYNDAIEIGSLLWLREHSRIDLSTGVHEAAVRFEWLEAALPVRHVRSESQVELQQFPTPPMLAWLMARAGSLHSKDILLEPSAGNGALAMWPAIEGCSVHANEIDPQRRAALATIFPEACISGHDGELIDHLCSGIRPTAVLMNPPFARSRERGVSGPTAMRHLRSACRLAIRGARVVAIMPEGFDAPGFVDAEGTLSLRLDARLSGAFRKTGTGIAVRLLVIDKVASTGPTKCADISDLVELACVLADLPSRAPRTAEVHRLPVRTAAKPLHPARGAKLLAPFLTRANTTTELHEALVYAPLEEPATVPEQVGLYLAYRASRIAIEDAPVHPTPLVESVAMGSVAAPIPQARPFLPSGWREKRLLSAAQCESLVYACEAFSHDLPGRYRPAHEATMLEQAEDGSQYRQGFFLGDGTGAGKGRQIAAVIMDRWLAGERRHVWITKNEALLEDARRDWEALGGLPLDIQSLSRWKLGAPVALPQGILFITYPTLRSGRCEDTRLGQLLAWAGEEFGGVIAFDEAHAMANALGGSAAGSSIRGKAKGSEQGMAGLRLQNHLPRARVLYASATGASDIANLGYASRLGLWGPETAFPTHESFMTQIRAGGVAAMELVARDLKAQGLYLARALSFAGVEYDILEHRLTEAQVRIYDAYADAWAIIHRNLDQALEATRIVDEDSGDTLNRNAKAAALSIFEGTKQRFFAQLLLSMKLPSLIPAMEQALATDHSVVVQLVSTAEAMLDRRLADLTPEEREALEIDLSPREYVVDYLVKSFPVRLMQVFTDEDGNLRSEAMSDDAGNPVLCPRAIAARDVLIENLSALPPIATALDAIIEHFGTGSVAEVTGRSRRLVISGDGQQRLERRSPSANLAEAQSFMDGAKRILVFSDAGGTGRSYHADLECQNRQRRVHFLLEPGWRADNAIQGLGRTNRTNQASAPLFRPVTTDVKGERRFISTIARRLDSLGALTRGQRQTGGQNLFDPADNLESDYAKDALIRWFHLLYDGKLEAASFSNFVRRTGLRLESPEGGLTDNLPTIQRWLNRVLALPIALQNAIFDEYLGLIEARIEAAREAGTLDLGLETIKVDTCGVLADQLLRTDPITGAQTRLLSLEVVRHLRPLRYERLTRLHDIGSEHAVPMRNARSGRVALCVPARRLIADDGGVIDRRRLLRPLKSANWTCGALGESAWESLDQAAFEQGWRAEEVEAASEPVTERVHLATGLLLPVWKRLPGDHIRVTRIVAGDGQSFLGREVAASDIAGVAETFGLGQAAMPAPQELADLVLVSGKSQLLQSHDALTIKRSLVGGEQRIELTGFAGDRLDWYKARGCFTEIIRYRTRLFVPVSGAPDILRSIAV